MEGLWLAKHRCIGAMQDVSDGVGSDIRRIMEQSRVGAEIRMDQLPLSRELLQVSRKYRWDAPSIALSAGEDYCLLFTIDADKYSQVRNDFKKKFRKEFYAIGTIRPASNGLTVLKNNKPVSQGTGGFDHFK